MLKNAYGSFDVRGWGRLAQMFGQRWNGRAVEFDELEIDRVSRVPNSFLVVRGDTAALELVHVVDDEQLDVTSSLHSRQRHVEFPVVVNRRRQVHAHLKERKRCKVRHRDRIGVAKDAHLKF
jgi:hypothetical protein